MSPRVIGEINRSRLKAKDVSHQGTHMNLRVWLYNLDLIFKVHWTVTFNLKLLSVGLTDEAGLAHIDAFREELILR